MRFAPAVVFIVLGPCLLAFGADPSKDPEGWDGIPFGSTFEQVVEKLGKRGRSRTSSLEEDATDKPLDHVVASEVHALAEEFLKAQKQNVDSIPKDVLDAARAMRKLTKTIFSHLNIHAIN